MYSSILSCKFGDALNISGKTSNILVTVFASGKGYWKARGGMGRKLTFCFIFFFGGCPFVMLIHLLLCFCNIYKKRAQS